MIYSFKMSYVFGIIFILTGIVLFKFKGRQTAWDANRAEAGVKTFKDIPALANLFRINKRLSRRYTPFSMSILSVGFVLAGLLVIVLTIFGKSS